MENTNVENNDMQEEKEVISKEGGVFQERLSYLIKEDGRSQRELSEYVDVSKQSISLYVSGKRTPDINAFFRMCEYFKVSADYLLGKSDVRSFDIENKSINEKLGLSEMSIEQISKFKNEESSFKNLESRMECLNWILSDLLFYVLVDHIIEFMRKKTFMDEIKMAYFSKYCKINKLDFDELSWDYDDEEYYKIKSDFDSLYDYLNLEFDEDDPKYNLNYQEFLVVKEFEKLLDDIKFEFHEEILKGKKFSEELNERIEAIDDTYFEKIVNAFNEGGQSAIFALKVKAFTDAISATKNCDSPNTEE